MSIAQAGHGALLAMEVDGAPAGTFTSIAELNGDITPPEFTRTASEATPHNENIDSYSTGVLRRSPMTASANFIFDDTTHDHLTGLYKRMIDNDFFGMRYRGPGGASNSDEWIMSGHLTNIKQMAPVREGVRTIEFTFQCSKAMIIDGVSFGTAA